MKIEGDWMDKILDDGAWEQQTLTRL